MNEILLLVVSILPIILLGFYIYKKDKNKESTKILTKLFFGGIGSCFLVVILTNILGIFFPFISADINSLNYFELFMNVFIEIALIEEFCKWFISYKYAFDEVEFDEIFDMIVYCVFVALGFAFFENLLYVFQGGIIVGIMRALSAVPGHACDGVFMGYYLGLAKLDKINNKDNKKNIILSILVPTILHGIYDYCLFANNGLFLLIFIVFVITLYIKTSKRIKEVAINNVRFGLVVCPSCGAEMNGNFCSNCGRKLM